MTTTTNNIIRQLRHRAGLTQLQLADRLGTAAKSWISDVENETDGPPGITTVCRIANACGVSVGYLPPAGWRILPDDFQLPPDVENHPLSANIANTCGHPPNLANQ